MPEPAAPDKVSFFYTTDTPHEWSSGRHVTTHDPETRGPIASLERARELALGARKGTPGHSGWVKTTYGVEFSDTL